MNPNLNNPSGIHHHHQPSHSLSQLQPSLHPLHNHTHLPPPQTHTPSHLPHQSHHHHHPSNPTSVRDPLDRQEQQRSNIEHYKSSADPAYSGYIGSTHDALIIFSGCYQGTFPMVSRRLHERERRSIRSGSVYVFDETKAGIKRWTDGRVWSPSRILNNFLVYREIDQKRPTAATNNPSGSSTNPPNPNPGPPPNTTTSTNNTAQKHEDDSGHHPKTATSTAGPTSHHSSEPSQSNSHYHRHHQTNPSGHPTSQAETRNSNELSALDSKSNLPKEENQEQTQPNSSPPPSNQRPMNRERERSLVGSLTSTYKFRPDGLVKKTISIAGMHMISYYKLDDVVAGRLRTPTSHASMLAIAIVPHLLNPGFFRAPPQWGISNGRMWIQEEGPDETSPISGTLSSVAPPIHNIHRPGASPLPPSGSAPSNPPQAIRTSHPSARLNASDRITSTALSRPGSSDSSTGSPSARSPTSPHSFLLLPPSNLNNSAAAPRSPVIGTAGGRPSFSRVHNSNNTSTPSAPAHLGRSSTISGAPSNRYEPYPRAARSPPHSASSTTNSTLTDQQASVQYFSPNHTTGSLNGYSTHSFLPDPPSTPLVGSDQQSASTRNTRNDSSVTNGRNLESVGQVSGYDEAATYRTATSTSGGGECIYSQYSITDSANNSHRSSSVPPPSYGLPSINRLGATGQPSSPSSSTGTRAIGDYQFTGSPNQPQSHRLSPSTGSHAGGSYGGYLSPAVADGTFRGTSGGSAMPERENNAYGSSSHPANSLTNSSGQASSGAGTQSSSFLYPPTSTSPSSAYPFNNPSRRGSAMATLSGEISNNSADSARGGARINSQNRPNGGGLQLSENTNGASHWGQMSSSHAMKKEEGAGG